MAGHGPARDPGQAPMLTYEGPVLTSPVRIRGAPVADLITATTGTDSDWVVKLIDVYPDEVPSQPEMGGCIHISRGYFSPKANRETLSIRQPFQPASPNNIASPCRPRITCSCQGIESWCKSSRVGSPAGGTRRRFVPIFFADRPII